MIRLESFFKQLMVIGEKCSFCDNPLWDATFFDAGNNAEVRVVANCCEVHAKELDRDSFSFQKKYADRIEELAAEAVRP